MDSNTNEVISDKIPRMLQEKNFRSKWSVTGRSVQGVTTTGVWYSIAGGIVQGIGSDQRIGDLIFVEKLDMRVSMQAGDVNNQCRMLVLFSQEPSIATPFNYLENGPSGGYDVLSFTYPYLKSNIVQVLYDNTWTLVDGSNTQYIHEEFSLPINKRVAYQYGTATPYSGAIYLMVLSDSGVAPHPQVNLNPKWWFRDL